MSKPIISFALPSENTEYYQRHPSIPEKVWNEAKPHFLPNDHPIKAQLDALFSYDRLLDSTENFIRSGFQIINPTRELKVATHPALEGYIIKFYLDTHNNYLRFLKLKLEDDYVSELRLWLLRVVGAQRMQSILDQHQYNHIIKVSKAWIYPLPVSPAAKGSFPKYFILVESDMNIVDDAENERRYREEMSPELLQAFFTVLKQSGFYDSVYIDNNPFSEDGKIAFVDTEEYDRKPVPFEELLPYFSLEMQIYWKQLILESYLSLLSLAL